MFKKLKKPNGITLIALIISIVVLLILAGVAISVAVGDNGVLTQASDSVVKNRETKAKEEVQLSWSSAETKYYTDWAKNTSVNKDDYYGDEKLLTSYVVDNGTIESSVKNSDGKSWTVKYRAKAQNQLYTFIIDDYGNINEYSEIIISCVISELLQESSAIVKIDKVSNDLKNKEIIWETSDENIALIENNGNSAKVTAVSGGVVKITAKIDDKISNECTITVLNKLSNIEDFEDISLEEGQTLQLNFPEYTENVICTTTENEYISVTNEGLISALKETETPIVITIIGDSKIEKVVKVNVIKVRTAVDVLKINLSETSDEKKNPYVIYESGITVNGDSNEILCRVLYNDLNKGLQIISIRNIGSVNLTNERYVRDLQSKFSNAVKILNDCSEKYLNESDGIAIDARCVGSKSNVSFNDNGIPLRFQ